MSARATRATGPGARAFLIVWALSSCRGRGAATADGGAATTALAADCSASEPALCRTRALAAIERRDDALAMALARRGCDAGHMPACKTLGWLYEMGRGTRADPARARALYERGCEGGDPGSCKSLAVLYDTGAGVPTDRARAAGLYQRACDGGELAACGNLANLLVGGDGVPRDAPRALALYDRVCAANASERACVNARTLRAASGADGGD